LNPRLKMHNLLQFEKLVESVGHRRILVGCVENPVIHNASFRGQTKLSSAWPMQRRQAWFWHPIFHFRNCSRMEIREILSRF
jgi:hypothetical protein